MTNLILGIIIGAVVATFTLSVADRMRERVVGACKFVLGQSDEKEKNLERLVVYLEDHDTITNDDVEALLDVSHATATRYLDELEDEDLIEQIGITGRAVHYKVK